MILSITRTAAAALVVGSVLLVTASDSKAMTAEEHEAALEQCQNAMKGQRSFCTIEANNAYMTSAAKAKNQDVTVHYNYDQSNDTPEQDATEETYNQAIEKCNEMMKGQRSFCAIEAQTKYNKEMGN